MFKIFLMKHSMFSELILLQSSDLLLNKLSNSLQSELNFFQQSSTYLNKAKKFLIKFTIILVLFLLMDGVVNKDLNYVYKIKDFV